ncbi:hypothetical protein WMZ97_06445 [Lentibacillus sp. N15]|uniref:hypothetical protein n=1 Tax=Lentibacillus songyuanensis TaxID=3136161 RepID=UPI0031BB4749
MKRLFPFLNTEKSGDSGFLGICMDVAICLGRDATEKGSINLGGGRVGIRERTNLPENEVIDREAENIDPGTSASTEARKTSTQE